MDVEGVDFVGQPRPPAGAAIALGGHGIDVVGQGQGHHVSLEPVHHGPGLLAGAAIGLVDMILAGAAFQTFTKAALTPGRAPGWDRS